MSKQSKELQDTIYSYKTANPEGFIQEEIIELLKGYPDINMDRYYDAMMCNTCMMTEDRKIINYHCDVYTAVLCGIEDREQYGYEFD